MAITTTRLKGWTIFDVYGQSICAARDDRAMLVFETSLALPEDDAARILYVRPDGAMIAFNEGVERFEEGIRDFDLTPGAVDAAYKEVVDNIAYDLEHFTKDEETVTLEGANDLAPADFLTGVEYLSFDDQRAAIAFVYLCDEYDIELLHDNAIAPLGIGEALVQLLYRARNV